MVGVPRPLDHAEDHPRRATRKGRLVARFDDELWELVPAEDHPHPPPRHLVEFVEGLPAEGHALDLGCGDGRLTAHLRTPSLTGADPSIVALVRAAERVHGARWVRIEPDEPLPFDDNSYDLVVSTEVLEHVRDVQLFLSEARRVLKPGGTLAVTTPAHSRRTALRLLVRGWESEFDPLSPHLRFFTRRSLTRLLDGLGFDVDSVRRSNGTLLCRTSRP